MPHDSPAPPWWQTLPYDFYLSAVETAIGLASEHRE